MKLITILFIIIALFVFYLSTPFFTIIFSSFLIAYMIEPFSHKLNKYIKNWNVSSLLLTIFSVIFFSGLFYLFTRMIIVSVLQIQNVFDTNVIFINNLLSTYTNVFFLESNPSNLVNFIETIFSITPKALMDYLLLIFLVFYLIRDAHIIKKWFYKILPKNEKNKLTFFIKRANYIIKNIIWEYLFVGIVIGAIVFVSLLFLQINFALELATIALIMSVFPIISGWMLTFILSFYYNFTADYLNGIILLIISILLFMIDYYFYRIFKVKKGINPLMLVMGIVSGIFSLGIFGFIAGPILAGIIQSGYETIFEQY